MAVEQAGDSWLWTIDRDGDELARASRPFASQAAAVDDADRFGSVLAVARGTGPVFHIDRQNDGWTWTLSRDGRSMAADSTVFPDARDSLDAVERTRQAAGVAEVVSERNRKPESGTPETDAAGIAE